MPRCSSGHMFVPRSQAWKQCCIVSLMGVGEFKWVAGVLTQAVMAGLWIVFEDIDLASMEVQSALLPLLERRELFIPGQSASGSQWT